MTNIINETAVDVFGRVKRRQRDVRKPITNPVIEKLQSRSRAIGGALRLVNHPLSPSSHSARLALTCFSLEHSLHAAANTTLRAFLIAKRKTVNKKLYLERSNEIYS